jgi:hypothetical protein
MIPNVDPTRGPSGAKCGGESGRIRDVMGGVRRERLPTVEARRTDREVRTTEPTVTAKVGGAAVIVPLTGVRCRAMTNGRSAMARSNPFERSIKPVARRVIESLFGRSRW